jgi:hypothetical protein
MPTTKRGRRLLLQCTVCCAVVIVGLRLIVDGGFGFSNNEAVDIFSPADRALDEPGTEAEFKRVVINDDLTVSEAAGVPQLATRDFEADAKQLGDHQLGSTQRADAVRSTAEVEKETDEEEQRQEVEDTEGVNTLSTFLQGAEDVAKFKTSLQVAISEIQDLIDQGLVVPKWNGEREEPAIPGGLGKAVLDDAIKINVMFRDGCL